MKRALHSAAARGRAPALLGVLLASAWLTACSDEVWNDPNPPNPPGVITYQSMMSPAPPKHLDPALSYSTDEALFVGQIYESPMGYHFLRRPYDLIPLGVESYPETTFLNAQGEPVDPAEEEPAFTRYTLTVPEDAYYQPHPSFARDASGQPLYLFDSAEAGERYHQIPDFPQTDARPVRAEDYVYGMKRLANPLLGSPMTGIMQQHVVGSEAFSEVVQAQQRDGDAWLDLRELPLEGLQVIDERRFSITIKERYPQFLYWLALPFFAPIPYEADRFYHNPGFVERNLTLDWWPVGSGPFMMVRNNPNSEIVLERNPNYRAAYYPGDGEPGDAEAGLLEDAGKRLPLIDRAVFRLERETMSLWTKFLQGYYDRSGEVHGNTSQVFDQAFVVGPDGVELTEELQSHNITVSPDVKPAIYFYGFNMRDPVLGGYTEEKRKLRRALQIAFNLEEFLKIFYKGNGIPAHSPIPPGIVGHEAGEAGINPYVYDWVDGEQRRKSLAEARQLMVEAGYPNGRDARTGAPLKIFIDVQSQATSSSHMNWIERAFSEIGVQVEFRPADWARTREKLLTGNTQIYSFGWIGDYPDAENFMLLLYGPESPLVCECDGLNPSNYEREEYDATFREMKLTPPGPEREAKIQRLVEMFQEDAVWLYTYYPEGIFLNNPWVHNTKRNGVAYNTLQYVRLDTDLREELRRRWNQPVTWPLYAAAALVIALLLPGVLAYRRRLRATAR